MVGLRGKGIVHFRGRVDEEPVASSPEQTLRGVQTNGEKETLEGECFDV